MERNTGSGIHALANLVKVTLVFSVSRPREVCDQNIADKMRGN